MCLSEGKSTFEITPCYIAVGYYDTRYITDLFLPRASVISSSPARLFASFSREGERERGEERERENGNNYARRAVVSCPRVTSPLSSVVISRLGNRE